MTRNDVYWLIGYALGFLVTLPLVLLSGYLFGLGLKLSGVCQ
jgi:uncharacterized membrane protein YedE/YeeE